MDDRTEAALSIAAAIFVLFVALLDDPEPFPFAEHDQQLRERASLLEKTFKDFDINVRVVGINTGPVITQYEMALETGLRLHKVTRLADDVALDQPAVRFFHALGLPVAAWTIKSQAQADKALARADQLVFEGFVPS